MSNKSSQIIILCEDTQQEVFVRRFLKKAKNIDGKMLRVVKNPSGKGSGEQFVRKEFPAQLTALRTRRAKTDLIVVIDADLSEVALIKQKLETACSQSNIEQRNASDRVSFIIPKRNIETWIQFLDGSETNEILVYQKSQKESNCKSAVDHLYKLCLSPDSTLGFPPSLLDACQEYKRLEM